MSACDECGCPNRFECGCAARRQERLFPVGEPAVDADALAAEIESWLSTDQARALLAPPAPGMQLTLARRTVMLEGQDGITGRLFTALMYAAGVAADAIELDRLPGMLGRPDVELSVSRHGSDTRSLAVFEIAGDDHSLVRWDDLIRAAERAWLPADCATIISSLLRHCRGCTAEGGASTVFFVTVCAGVVAWHYAGRPVLAVSGPLELGFSGDARALPPLPAIVSRPACMTDLAGAALLNSFWQPLSPPGQAQLELAAESGDGAAVARAGLWLAG